MFPAYRTADETFAMPPFARTRSASDAFLDELRGCHTAFRACCTRQAPRDPFCHYLVGQVSGLARQSLEPMALQVAGGHVRAMQRLVSEARWDDEAMRKTSHGLVQDERGEPAGGLSVAATGCVKKGIDSGGGARQYCGTGGQVEHGHVGGGAASASRQGDAFVDQRRFLPASWGTDAYPARRTKWKGPDEVPWPSKPPRAAAMGQALHRAGGRPCKDRVADGRDGKRPDVGAACEACVGTVAFGAPPADTRGWLQPGAPTTPPSTSKGEPHTKRPAMAPAPAPCTVAALAQAISPTFWDRRPVSEGPPGPLPYACARTRLLVCQDGQPPTAVWLRMQRSLGAHPQSWYALSNAPLRVPGRLLVWLSGVRWAIDQGFEEAKAALGMDHYAVRQDPGWPHHRLTGMRAHCFLWHRQIRLEKKRTRYDGLASPEVIGGGFTPQRLQCR
jgi:hypothetical protein